MGFYSHFNLTMDRSPGFGSYTCNSAIYLLMARPLQTRFPFGSAPSVLNLAASIYSPDHSTKGTRSPVDGLSVLVGTGFQVLFHSPPGVLFTFPSQYYTLSVIRWYLGLEGGPPDFPRNSTCSAVLWIPPASNRCRLRDSHTLWWAFPHPSATSSHALCGP